MFKTLLKLFTLVCSDKILSISAILVAVLLSSCGPKRNLIYLSDLNDSTIYRSAISNITEPRIQHGDILGISISNVDPESSNLFNKGLLPVANPAPTNTGTATPNDGGYLVDKAGDINFPSLGKIKLSGLNIEEAIDKIAGMVGKYVKNPIVSIKLLNFKITVIGEVSKPGVFNIASNKVNVLEALGLAGDMTMYGKRENVVVIHEENGNRTITPMDMNNSNVLQSPAFYLQQNDVVYVKPDKMKEKQARTDTKTISIIVAAATVITVIISRLF